MSRILLTGIITLDIIHFVDHYPLEDSEQRASQQIFETGGNTANSSYILKQLGHEPKLAATIADDPAAAFICQQLQQRGVDYFDQWQIANSQSPTSCITINQQNASRTITHYRDLPELQARQFEQIDTHKFDWLHFEGRNITQLENILRTIAGQPHAPISLEVEKDLPDIECLLPYGDVIFFSRNFALQRGFKEAAECLQHFASIYPHKRLFCAWGEFGAWAIQSSRLYHSPAVPPAHLIDTRAAGDTFNAACIDGLLKQQSIVQILQDACTLAGRKCGQKGLDNLITPGDIL